MAGRGAEARLLVEVGTWSGGGGLQNKPRHLDFFSPYVILLINIHAVLREPISKGRKFCSLRI